ncbi:ATP-binding protein [Streptomyces davaonensis JCM 4913]|uniref:ATP-binding protein n=1 Tax=Streptomyces davaonensis (strain DSM 101723 / JCM 4913 / KCC S-0913 / 768) TaxID=1214101 RepID=K4R006_STRDJ|nr:ABC transporter ATP-binding protein [Streptomyces davaonensis]CCK26415.1 ATP-binding protein [Streptomyces davaonensis JCM 4913]
MNAVEVLGLRREFPPSKGGRNPSRTALDGIDLTVGEGEVHALLGPNGAGKTTLCRILATVLVPSAGTARILGHDVVTELTTVRPLIGCVFGGDRGLYGRLSARRNLCYWGALYGIPGREIRGRAAELLDRFGLRAHADERVETFSRGMKQRLHLARGLMHGPRVLLLDEPTTGMDPVAARDFRTLIGELRGEGRSVLLTTHDMAEAETVCDRATLIDGGRIRHTATPRELGALLSRHERIEVGGVPAPLLARLDSCPEVTSVRTGPDGSTVIEVSGQSALGPVLRLLVDGGVTDLATTRPSLEEVYLRLIGDRGMEVAS